MNILIIIGFVLAGGTIAFDHLIHELPRWLAILLYSAAVILRCVASDDPIDPPLKCILHQDECRILAKCRDIIEKSNNAEPLSSA